MDRVVTRWTLQISRGTDIPRRGGAAPVGHGSISSISQRRAKARNPTREGLLSNRHETRAAGRPSAKVKLREGAQTIPLLEAQVNHTGPGEPMVVSVLGGSKWPRRRHGATGRPCCPAACPWVET